MISYREIRENKYTAKIRPLKVVNCVFTSILGNKYINRLTASGNFQLKVYLRKDGGLMHNCIYSTFSVGDAASNYTLSVDGYTGNTGIRRQ